MSNTVETADKITVLFGKAKRYLALQEALDPNREGEEALLEFSVKSLDPKGHTRTVLIETVYTEDTTALAKTLVAAARDEASRKLEEYRVELAKLGVQVVWGNLA